MTMHRCTIEEVLPAHWSSGGQRRIAAKLLGERVILRVPRGARGFVVGAEVDIRHESVVEIERTDLYGRKLESAFMAGDAFYVEGIVR